MVGFFFPVGKALHQLKSRCLKVVFLKSISPLKTEAMDGYMMMDWLSAAIEFECEFCSGRFFEYKGDLTKHMQTHVGDYIYKCDVCDQGFRYHTALRQHSFEHYKEDKEKGVNATNSWNESIA